MNKKSRWVLAIFVFGLIAGVIFGIGKVRATSPINEASQGNVGMYYNEIWDATEALVSTDSGTGFTTVPITNSAGSTVNQVSAKFSKVTSGSGSSYEVTVAPKMIVTKWKVHGHIHQQ